MAFFRTSRSPQSAWKPDEGRRAASAANVIKTRGLTQEAILPLLACERSGAGWPHVARVGGWAPLRGRTQEAILPLLACERSGAGWPHVEKGSRVKPSWERSEALFLPKRVRG